MGGSNWTEGQYLEYLARLQREVEQDHEADPGPESALQGKIMQWAKRRGYPIQANRQTKNAKGLLTPGWPDITLILPDGKVLFIELKSSRGRLSPEQKHLRLQFMALGHRVHEVRSYKRFLEVLNEERR